jgi:hypothetical protein
VGGDPDDTGDDKQIQERIKYGFVDKTVSEKCNGASVTDTQLNPANFAVPKVIMVPDDESVVIVEAPDPKELNVFVSDLTKLVFAKVMSNLKYQFS